MITVRFPNGQAVQYNNGHYVERAATCHIIRTSERGALIAIAPREAIIEWTTPCRVYNPLVRTDVDERVANEIRLLKRAVRELVRKKV